MIYHDLDSLRIPSAVIFSQYLSQQIMLQNVADEPEEDIYYYHPDHLGSASYISDASGLATQHIEYFPFGEVFVEENVGTFKSMYKFNAKELDDESGLYYYGARYYDPRSSVFLGVDPMSDKFPGWSPYTYTLDNPIRFIDIDGKYAQEPIKGSSSPSLSNWQKAEAALKSNTPGSTPNPSADPLQLAPLGNGSGRIESAPVLDVLFGLATDAISEGLQYLGMGEKSANITASVGILVVSALKGNPKMCIRKVDDLLKAAGKFSNQKNAKISLTPIKGKIDDIFQEITKGGSPRASGGVDIDGVTVTKYSGGSGPTIQINKNDGSKPFKIRVEDE